MAVRGKIRRRLEGQGPGLCGEAGQAGGGTLHCEQGKALWAPTPPPSHRRAWGAPRPQPLLLKPTAEFQCWTGRVWEPPSRKTATF